MSASDRQRHQALVVDDEPTIVELLGITLEGMGLEVLACHSLAEAFAALAAGPPSLCLTDLRLGDGSGMQLLQKIRERYPQVPVAVITAYASAEGAVEAMRAGAFDFMTKPIELARLRRLVAEAIALGELPREVEDLSERLVGRSPAMVALRERVRLLGRSNAPVHIRGESGTGKELVAQAIHDASPRRDKAFIAVNCGAIPENLMESEFFGAEKGAYSGAVQRREGLFLAANGGTLFLDEIAELPLTTQVKLLRVLQERVVRPLGGLREIGVDIRLICATHRDLRRMVAEGTFREDLFYRINVVPVEIPPLRERREDIPVLAEALLERLCQRHGRPIASLEPEALAWLSTRDFPGNVRELENLLERALALQSRPLLRREDLEPTPTTTAPLPSLPDTPTGADTALAQRLAEAESSYLASLQIRFRDRPEELARTLGISLQSLRLRLAQGGPALDS
ncbi:MAG: sigma-54-dependent transcriptional regulator [Acidithiobacillus sp.]